MSNSSFQMKTLLEAAVPNAIVVGAVLKLMFDNDWNQAMLIISSIVFLILAFDNYKQFVAHKQHTPSSFVKLTAIAAFEVIVYQSVLIINISATVLALAYLTFIYKDTTNKSVSGRIIAWTVVRFIIITFSAPASHESWWRLSQLLLFLAIFSTILLKYTKQASDMIGKDRTRIVGTSTLAIVWFIYSIDDVVPQSVPIPILAMPLVYMVSTCLHGESKLHANDWQEKEWLDVAIKIIVLITVILSFVWPHHDIINDVIEPCGSYSNTQTCLSGSAQVRITEHCCCKQGFVKMPKKQACVIEDCVSNLKRNPLQDCCKIRRDPSTESLLSGAYMCRCNNQPGTTLNEYSATNNKCLCKQPFYGTACQFTSTETQ